MTGLLEKTNTTVFFILCILCTVDTTLFVYPSLSRSLLFSLLALSLASIAFTTWLTKRNVTFGKCDTYTMAWIAYLLVHSAMVDAEQYRLGYLLCSLMFLLAVTALLRQRLIKWQTIENGLLLIAAIHIAFMIAQATGLAGARSEFFSITGANENPNITAMYLAGCIPLLVRRSQQASRKALFAVMVCAAIIALLALRCRTAYVGLATMGIVWVAGKGWHKRRHTVFGCLCATAIVIGGTTLYKMKKDSADGRMLVWKLSAKMIADKPQGYGYGMFEKHYNLRQAEYFASRKASETERRNADYVAMAYNDYLEQGVEGGIIGMAFYIGFFLLTAFSAHKRHDWEALAVTAAFAAMALFNFVYTAIQPWLLLLCYGAKTAAGCTEPTSHPRNTPLTAATACLCLTVALQLLWQEAGKIAAQASLTKPYHTLASGNAVDTAHMESLGNGIGTSEAYFKSMALANMKAGRHDKAIGCIDRAMGYTSAPELFYMKSSCLMKTGKPKEAATCMTTVNNMTPRSLRPKRWLMRYYFHSRQEAKAMSMAHDILGTPVKTKTKEAQTIKREAEAFLKGTSN